MELARDESRAALFALAILALLAGGLGCGSSCPRYDDRNWRELSTRNFRLRTDLDEDKAREKLKEIETVRAALLTSFRVSPDTNTGQLSVVALDAGWGAAAGPLVPGIFFRALYTPQIAMRAGSSLIGQSVVKHELVHHLSRFVRPSEAPWLSKGLAMYFETMEISDDRRLVTVGRPEPSNVYWIQHHGFNPVEELLAATDLRDDAFFSYPSAWLLVHYLMNHRTEAFRSYQHALATNASESQAWAAGFGDLTPARLDAELREYVDGGKYAVYKFPFVAPNIHVVSARSLPPADAHATRALIYVVMSQRSNTDMLPRNSDELRVCARQELDAAFADDAENTLGLAIMTWGLAEAVDVMRAERSASKNPTDWMAWWLLAATLRQHGIDDDRVAAAEEKAVDLAAANPAIDVKALKVVRHRK
jgi:hypothetical protein